MGEPIQNSASGIRINCIPILFVTMLSVFGGNAVGTDKSAALLSSFSGTSTSALTSILLISDDLLLSGREFSALRVWTVISIIPNTAITTAAIFELRCSILLPLRLYVHLNRRQRFVTTERDVIVVTELQKKQIV